MKGNVLLVGGRSKAKALAQSLLKKCTYRELYPRNRRDAVVIFCLQHNCSIMETNDILYEYSLPVFI